MKYLIALAVLNLAACATGPKIDPVLHAAGIKPLYCDSEAQCNLYMERAQAWLATHSHYRIQIANSVQISTYGGVTPDMDLSYTVIREKQADGRSRILVRAGCQNAFGCDKDPYDAIGMMKLYIVQQ